MTPKDIEKLKLELSLLFGEDEYLLAMWSKRENKEGREFDNHKNIKKWLTLFDGINTDFPNNFWKNERTQKRELM